MSDTTLATPERRRATRKGRWPTGIYVGRPRKYGNPYIIGTHGDAQECVRLYREALTTTGIPHPRPGRPPVTVDTVRAELAGHHLLCWCPPEMPCHADVLLQIANDR